MPYYDLTDIDFHAGITDLEKIKIDPNDNVCSVCGKPYTHRKLFSFKVDGIKSVDFITAHAGGRSLIEKIKKLKDELLELEYKLFCKKI